MEQILHDTNPETKTETGAAAVTVTTALVPLSNQETEYVAMTCKGDGSSEDPPSQALDFEAIATTKTKKLDAPLKSIGCNNHYSSLKNRRPSATSVNRPSQQNRNKLGHGSSSGLTAATSGVSGVSGSNGNREMKTSHSMTSLPPDDEQQERRDVLKAKLHSERPYNSLKKNTQSGNAVGSNKGKCSSSNHNNNIKMHRYSWGSGYSHTSSTSLHSSATLGLGSSGKDDLWAAIQTNYNYIMDTNLLDTCKEARCEIEGASTVLEISNECCFKMLDETQRNESICEDPKELRRWLREMECKLESSPTISELTMFSNLDLQRHLAVHSVLYHEIVSHARVVSACIRAASEGDNPQQLSQSQQPASLTSNCSSSSISDATKSSSTSSGFASEAALLATPAAVSSSSQHKKGEGNLERLRDRYHLLYLKAFEVQLCLDNLLRKRSSTTNDLDDDNSDDSFSYEGAATEDDLKDVGSDLEVENENAKTQNLSSTLTAIQLNGYHITDAKISLQSAETPATEPHKSIATQKIPKVADASSDDDESWLYTASVPKDVNSSASALKPAFAYVNGVQSAAISSTTSSGAQVVNTITAPSDYDYGKENKEAVVTTTTSLKEATVKPTKASTEALLVAHAADIIIGGGGFDASSNCDSSSRSSASSSNGVNTETSAASRVTQMQRIDMELQINVPSNASDGINSNNNKNIHHTGCINNYSKQQKGDNKSHYPSSSQKNKHNQLHQKSCQSTKQQMDNYNRMGACVGLGHDGAVAVNSGNLAQPSASVYSRSDVCNISVMPCEVNSLNRRSMLTTTNKLIRMSEEKVSHDSIKQLVHDAEHLVRDAHETILKTPTKQKHSLVKISSTVKKRETNMPGPTNQRVEEWLEHQPIIRNLPNRTTELVGGVKSLDDCEASGEASETDSILHPEGSQTSEEFTESIATCMQTSTNSYENSTERIGGSAEPISQAHIQLGCGSSNHSLNIKVNKRQQTRRKSERPWSVSCLSQLTTDATQLNTIVADGTNASAALANHSISESALDSLSPGPLPETTSTARKAESKGSLRRRRARRKRLLAASAGKKTESGSEVQGDLTQTLMKSCESMSSEQLQEFTNALISIQKGNPSSKNLSTESGGEEQQLILPKFRVGSFTTALMASESRLGALAALSNYMHEDEQQAELSTEDYHSSISETAWDNYQEKYNSENYSEGFDSDAARRLLEFGDDYRNFIDSQSDCCSSLSAANNLDSLSPPRMDSLQQHESKPLNINQEIITSSVDHVRRQNVLKIQYERRRKTLEVRRKSCQDVADTVNSQQTRSATLSASATTLTTKKGSHLGVSKVDADSVGRKLEFGVSMNNSAQSLLRRTSESDTSTRRRRTITADERRRSSRNSEKCIKLIPATSSSSGEASDEEEEMRSLLRQSRDRLENTCALKIRCHLLRPEDYHEIINTCRDNIRCLEAVLRGPPSSVLSAQCASQTKDLLAAWEDLCNWSENAGGARQLQQQMSVLKDTLQQLANKPTPELLETEPSIQVAIEALKVEQTQLVSYRTKMLSLNASVHSWLTRQELRLKKLLEEQGENQSEPHSIFLNQAEKSEQQVHQNTETNVETTNRKTTTTITVTDSNGNRVETVTEKGTCTSATSTDSSMSKAHTLMSSEVEFHKHLKEMVSEMYCAWDEADARIKTQLDKLTTSLITWRQLESGLFEFQQSLGQDRGTLKGLEGALDKGQATAAEMVQNVKLVAKLLSEKVNISQEHLIAVHEHLDPNHIFHIAKFTHSNGSLSDSGISDGGATSDGGLSERERRLGVLRRLAKQLESSLAPGSEAMRSIAARMERAETELKQLQNTCRDLIVRTAATHQSKKQEHEAPIHLTTSAVDGLKVLNHEERNQISNPNVHTKMAKELANQNKTTKKSSPSQRKNKRKSQKSMENNTEEDQFVAVNSPIVAAGGNGGGPTDDPPLEYPINNHNYYDDCEEGQGEQRRGWAWRIAKAAVPMQLALLTFFCAACLLQPNCCDNINNLSMSFTPHLRYIRGPPPI